MWWLYPDLILTRGGVLISFCSFRGLLHSVFNRLGLRSQCFFQSFKSELEHSWYKPAKYFLIFPSCMGFFYLTQLFFLLNSLTFHLFLSLFSVILFFTSIIEAMSPVLYWGRQTIFRFFFCIHIAISSKPFLSLSIPEAVPLLFQNISFSYGLCFPSPFFIPLKSEICQVCVLITNRLLYLPLWSTAQGRSAYTNPSSILNFSKAFAQIKFLLALPFWFSGLGGKYENNVEHLLPPGLLLSLLSVTLLCLQGLASDCNVSLQGPFRFLPSCFLGMVGLPECAKVGGGRGDGVCVYMCGLGAEHNYLTSINICTDGDLKLAAVLHSGGSSWACESDNQL